MPVLTTALSIRSLSRSQSAKRAKQARRETQQKRLESKAATTIQARRKGLVTRRETEVLSRAQEAPLMTSDDL